MKMSYPHFVLESNGGYTSLTFQGKPSEQVRTALKANKYRWSGSMGHWWKATGLYADFVASLSRMMDREIGMRRPDGACWVCKDPNGFFRPYGSATPVRCDACEKKHVDGEAAAAAERRALDIDLLYENQCRDACGL